FVCIGDIVETTSIAPPVGLKNLDFIGKEIPEDDNRNVKQKLISNWLGPNTYSPERQTNINKYLKKNKKITGLTRTDYICDQEIFSLRCPKGTFIHIYSTFFGKTQLGEDDSNCPIGFEDYAFPDDYPCAETEIDYKMDLYFEGRNYYKLKVSDKLISSNTCPDSKKYLSTIFDCVPVSKIPAEYVYKGKPVAETNPISKEKLDMIDVLKPFAKDPTGRINAAKLFSENIKKADEQVTFVDTICEENFVKLYCESGQRLHIITAFFGASAMNEKNKCSPEPKSASSDPCYTQSILPFLDDRCDGKDSCIIGVNKAMKMESCKEIPNYLTLKFVCIGDIVETTSIAPPVGLKNLDFIGKEIPEDDNRNVKQKLISN
ncbi:hypothetical protein SNEBB_003588, partial [Seison nebaliae]